MALHTKLFDIDFLNSLSSQYQTPCYIYSQELIECAVSQYQSAFGDHKHQICYAVKANSNLSILSILNNLGCGFDICSIGELNRCLAVGADVSKIILSGVGKTDAEIKAALSANIGCFNIESVEEIFLVNSIAKQLHQHVRVGLRVNPDVNPNTHPYISTGLKSNKFGLTIAETLSILNELKSGNLSNIRVIGLGFHIGSQLMEVAPILQSIHSVVPLIREYERATGSKMHHIDIGGGLGLDYSMIPFAKSNHDESDCNVDGSLSPVQLNRVLRKYLFGRIDMFIGAVKQELAKYEDYRDLCIVCEPGRSIVGYAGVLLTKVLFVKQKRGDDAKQFVIVDGSMSELIRPALYGGKHPTVLLKDKVGSEDKVSVDVVGPVCESGDFLAKDRVIAGVHRDDLLCVCHCGAYGYVMSSNYNSRCKVMELLIDSDNKVRVVKPRQTMDGLFGDERKLLRSHL